MLTRVFLSQTPYLIRADRRGRLGPVSPPWVVNFFSHASLITPRWLAVAMRLANTANFCCDPPSPQLSCRAAIQAALSAPSSLRNASAKSGSLWYFSISFQVFSGKPPGFSYVAASSLALAFAAAGLANRPIDSVGTIPEPKPNWLSSLESCSAMPWRRFSIGVSPSIHEATPISVLIDLVDSPTLPKEFFSPGIFSSIPLFADFRSLIIFRMRAGSIPANSAPPSSSLGAIARHLSKRSVATAVTGRSAPCATVWPRRGARLGGSAEHGDELVVQAVQGAVVRLALVGQPAAPLFGRGLVHTLPLAMLLVGLSSFLPSSL